MTGRAVTRSYERLNYALRPAKQVERRMLLRALQRLQGFAPLSAYQYVGLGSVYFVDFVMIHRSLGISAMVSIEDESDPGVQERFRYNTPFACVDLKFGHTNRVLPYLNWDPRTIVWLDYDGPLDRRSLTDVATLAHSAQSGSLIAFTFNASGERPVPAKKLSAVDVFFRRIPEELRPVGLTDSDVNVAKMPITIRRIVNAQIDETLRRRNTLLPATEQLSAEQVLFFEYSDSSPMTTIAYLLVADKEKDRSVTCNWNDLPFVRRSADPYRIAAPALTARELRRLESQLPTAAGAPVGIGIPDEQLRAFSELYPYYPAFVEVSSF